MVAVGLLCMSMSFVNSSVSNRIAYYYIIQVCLLVPMAVRTYGKRLSFLFAYGACTVCILFILIVQPHVLASDAYIPYWMA